MIGPYKSWHREERELEICFWILKGRGMRERSPPLPKITHPSPPVWGIAGFNKAECNAESPPGGTACLITVSSVPGKLTSTLAHHSIYNHWTETLVVFISLFTIFTVHNYFAFVLHTCTYACKVRIATP